MIHKNLNFVVNQFQYIMKKITTLKIGILTLLSAFMSCIEPNKKQDETVKTPQQIINIETAIEMYQEDLKIKDKVINPSLRDLYQDNTFEDTQFTWFSIDEMRDYIKYIDAIQKENPKQDISGIRIYFGRYSRNNSKKYVNQQTVFMVPTVSNKGVNSKYENLNHLPFAILPDESNNPIKGEYSIIEELLLDVGKKDRIKNFMKSTTNKQQAAFSLPALNYNPVLQLTSVILNEGEMAPPPKKEQ